MPLGASRFGLSGADLGRLQLIETKTVSGVSSAIFTSIQENTYNVHFMTIQKYQPTTDDQSFRIRFFESGVEESSSVYQRAQFISDTAPSNADFRSTGDDKIVAIWNTGSATNEIGNAYLYFYNLGDSSKYSFVTQQEVHYTKTPRLRQSFGSAVLPQTSTVDQIKLFVPTGNFSCTASLYGIKE